MRNAAFKQLTPSQQQAVSQIDGPLLVIAGPGSGKTRVITYRIAALIEAGVKPYNICAITFTNKAAEEMRQRSEALGASSGIHISTFHSLCVRILRQYADSANIKSGFSIFDTKDQSKCVRQAVKDCGLDTSNFAPARMLNAISALKNNLEDVDSFKATADDFFTKSLSLVYSRYQDILSKNDAVDFDDLLMKTAFLLRDNPDICAALGERFKYLLVDEYQDTNQAQYRIANSIASAHSNIFVTGDPDQSIYRWRGADIRNILVFEEDWPDAKVVKLEENFRSTPNILGVADKLIATNRRRKLKKLIPTRPQGKDVVVNVFNDEAEEAHEIAKQIEKLVAEGVSLRDVAVCYRVNSMSRIVEEALIKNKIAYQIVRGVEFYGRKEIRDMLAYLKVLANPSDEVALLRIINTPTRGIGKTTITRVQEYSATSNISFFEGLGRVQQIDSLAKAAKSKIAVFFNMMEQLKTGLDGKVASLAERVFVESGLKKSFQIVGAKTQDDSVLENVGELINAAAKYDQQTDQPSLVDYLQQISLFSDVDVYDPSTERVALMTLHAAKGLEFENVFIPGLEEGILPHERCGTDEDEIEEERRLLFVGITRAKSGLYISYAKYRTIRGQLLRTIPSPFLYELGLNFSESVQENQYCYDDIDVDNDINDNEQPTQPFFRDQLVRHRKFGLGRVKGFEDMGGNSIVTVKFNTGQTRELMVKYAGLEVISI